MAAKTVAKREEPVFIPVQNGAIAKVLREKGRLPPVAIRIIPIGDETRQTFYAESFVSYKFNNSILIPVDSFSFSLAFDGTGLPSVPVKEGDLISLEANRQSLAVGIVDTVTVETDAIAGTTLTIDGRDLMGQFEDQDAVSLDSAPIYSNKYTVDQVIGRLAKDTRVPTKPVKLSTPKTAYLFATQPGETKLSALQRYTESLNLLFWMDENGNLVIGKPNLWQSPKGVLKCSRKERDSNVLSIRSTRNSTACPNIVVPIWNGQETVQNRVSKEQILYNQNRGPADLRKRGHRVIRSIVVSTPEGSSPQDLAEINLITATTGGNTVTRAGAANLLQAYAKREMARANIHELQVQCRVVGHYNDRGEPYKADQVYRIQYDLDGIDEDMYLYQVEYEMSEGGSQQTSLFFCRQVNTLVSDVKVL